MKEEIDLEVEYDKWEDKLDADLVEYFPHKFKINNYQIAVGRIINQMEKDVKIKCEEQIKEYRKNVFIDGEDNYQAKPKPGLAIEAERAYKRLEKCTEFMYEMLSDLNENVEFAERFYYSQFDLCRMDCLKKMTPFYIKHNQVCLRKCRFYTFSYIDKATEDALQKWLVRNAMKTDTRAHEDKFEWMWYPK